jgi:hypothetical protein
LADAKNDRANAGRRLGGGLGLALLPLLVAIGPCESLGGFPFEFEAPLGGQLSLSDPLEVRLRVPESSVVPGSFRLSVDGVAVDAESVLPLGAATAEGLFRTGSLTGLGSGQHLLSASLLLDVMGVRFRLGRVVRFELVDLTLPDECEILNAIDCLLPYPSARFLQPAATPTGVHIVFPEAGMPPLAVGTPIDLLQGRRSRLHPGVYEELDGFSPAVHPVMHFPQGLDLEASAAPRLLPATRNYDLRSLDADSPSVLLDLDTGERIVHFLENDARATGALLPRQVTFLRPGRSLLPGHRYAVAMRDLVARDGTPVQPEAAFEALRDGQPSSIAALEARRSDFEALFDRLAQEGIPRDDLVLAFEFVTASDQTLTSEMLSMRDRGLAWLATQDPASLFTVDTVHEVTPPQQCQPGLVWREVRGTFKVPLFLHKVLGGPADPIANPGTLGLIANDESGPVQSGFTHPPYGISIPCSVVLGQDAHALLFGHGIFGHGPNTALRNVARDLPALGRSLQSRGLLSSDVPLGYIVGGTHWSGLSTLDVPTSLPNDVNDIQQLLPVLESFLGKLFVNFDFFAALPDRLRQGQLHALVLGRLMKTGAFNVHPAFQWQGEGVFGPDREMFYAGSSLGGIMGMMHLALSQDLLRGNVDVPSINFSFLLQRARPFQPFQAFLDAVEPDPLLQALGLSLFHEQWVQGEPAGYVHHVTGNTLPMLSPDTPPKRVLMTVALYDQQVSTLGAQAAAASMGLPNLDGSVNDELPLLADSSGPQAGAHVIFDTGSYQVGVHDLFIPPLANQFAGIDNRCDPHGLRLRIPAALEQTLRFLQPGGEAENFCNGRCDADGPVELPLGDDEPCDPF